MVSGMHDLSSSSSPSSTTDLPPNPLLTAYEKYLESTPLVTRYLLAGQVISYLLSWFLNLHTALATIPHQILNQYQIYRLVLSPLINTRLFNVIFSFLGFLNLGRRMEQSMGSLPFAHLCLLITVLSNTIFCLICLLLANIFDPIWMNQSSAGVWTIFFGIIAMECVKAPRDTKRALFFFQVPTLYYPLALLLFFTFLGGSLALGSMVSVALGYLFGFGYLLHSLSLSIGQIRSIEESIPLSREPGWITNSSILGSGAWSTEINSEGMVRF